MTTESVLSRLKAYLSSISDVTLYEGHPAVLVNEAVGEIERLAKERDEAQRRRDEWRKKAEGFDEVRLALREKVGTPWPPNLSRALWAGIAADERKRAETSEAKVAELTEALKWFVDREPPIQHKFNLHGPEDTATAMVAAFRSARRALEAK